VNISFEDKVALVTGAGSGLGLATAKTFAESGASVALADADEQAVRAAVEDLTARGHNALAIRCDVADDAEVESMVERTVAAFGRLDAAYNNAGVQNVAVEAAESTREDFDRVISINLRGVWSCMKFELRQMLKQGNGAIVNCSSIGGLVAGPKRGTYQASKHGVLGLTKSAALDYAARGIRINAVCPGIIHTAMLDKMMATQAEPSTRCCRTFPSAGLAAPKRSQAPYSGCAAQKQVSWSVTRSPWMAAIPYVELWNP
jgi:NAD(P)-dependent dehydrogenase (short-subunit alcohol dehydrogenase family)